MTALRSSKREKDWKEFTASRAEYGQQVYIPVLQGVGSIYDSLTRRDCEGKAQDVMGQPDTTMHAVAQLLLCAQYVEAWLRSNLF